LWNSRRAFRLRHAAGGRISQGQRPPRGTDPGPPLTALGIEFVELDLSRTQGAIQRDHRLLNRENGRQIDGGAGDNRDQHDSEERDFVVSKSGPIRADALTAGTGRQDDRRRRRKRRQVPAVKFGGRGKPDHRGWAGSKCVAHQLIAVLGLAAYDLEHSEARPSPATALHISPDFGIGVAGLASLSNTEDAVGDGKFRIGLKHSLTIADPPTRPRRTCG